MKCVGSARLDVVHESMRQVFDDVSKDLNFADCEPAYDTVQQTEAQHCKCAGEVDTYVNVRAQHRCMVCITLEHQHSNTGTNSTKSM